ncbi:hypothetical protein M0R45_008856 [Rubus argutus]|uniref:Reverse transcriptase domain-containing protein n=1 Tax=Rubus argutus TaxID=59490 RepID=A0AAW1Y2G8_RUBAR
MADRLALVASRIISPNQSEGRSITDPIKCIHLLDRKCKHGNIAIKFDIRKAFDTLDLCFLLRVVTSFGFAPSFVNGIDSILRSAYLSVNVNAQSYGYFTCSRGVRQGDPLSPLLFCLAEEVLSRGLSLLVNNSKLKRIAALRTTSPPTHVLFADDVMVFIQGNARYLRVLMRFMEEYACNSSQEVNKDKSFLFLGKFTVPWQHNIQSILGIKVGTLPFTYLGVPIFRGRPKSVYFLTIIDNVRSKLSAWKGLQLSQAGRLQLIASVIQSHLIYSFQVYAWPKSSIQKMQRWVRNFFWNGDQFKNGSALISWFNCCAPKDQGGLGLKNLAALNSALLLKRSWEVASGLTCSASFLRDRFIVTGLQPVSYYKKSSVWLGIKALWPKLLLNIRWLVGSGNSISFWKDNWLGEAIVSSCNIDPMYWGCLNDKVCSFIHNGSWKLAFSFQRTFTVVAQAILDVKLPIDCTSDQFI